MEQIYLDNNATTRIDPVVVQAMNDCYRLRLANPASQHESGRRARRILENAREATAAMLGCQLAEDRSDRLIYTSGGTEANNLALFGLAGSPPARILISAIEHPSIIAAAEQLKGRGFDVRQLPVDQSGVVPVDTVVDHLSQDTRLVSLMLGNNETGVLQPVQEVAQACLDKGVLFHTDAVQAVGKIPVNFAQLQADALSLTAHKFHGPRGIGALLIKRGTPLQPMLFGGFQQAALRPGTEAVVLAVGLEKALEQWQNDSDKRLTRMTRMRDRLENALCQEFPQAIVPGAAANRLPHTTNISFPGLDRQAIVMALDLAGVACSTGSACASGSSEQSPVLLAMGLQNQVVEGSIRISLGADTTEADIDQAICRICRVVNNLYR